MPPLTFDASSPEPPPDPDPAGILLVREAQPQPQLFFFGHVEPSPEAANDYVPPRPVVVPAKFPVAVPAARPKRGNFLVRFFGLFRRHRAPCAGAGCGAAGN
jgi:hypothetical protein